MALPCPVATSGQASLGHYSGYCKRCNLGGCDLKILDCGCLCHTRCLVIPDGMPMSICPLCHQPSRAILLLPMAFDEIDQAQAEAANSTFSDKRGKKRKNATISRLNALDGEGSELRTGRWTNEETAYCDKLIEHFNAGSLPIPDGIKLNDFLANMLKSKQSRLTKKMKNAKLSSKQYKRNLGYIPLDNDARDFSILESEFYASIRCNMERSEIRFHMQKEWRELFSNYCLKIGRTIDANDWLHSVEELDRRATQQKNAARLARRKIMMGQALQEDSINPPSGVFIDSSLSSGVRVDPSVSVSSNGSDNEGDAHSNRKKRAKQNGGRIRPPRHFSSAFIGKVIEYMQRHGVPFEHVDVWVPSFVSADGVPDIGDNQQCRLCFAGCGTAEAQLPESSNVPVPLTSEEQFDLISFGEYSQKFSFDVGSGLPGRVYLSGVSSWERGIQNAPTGKFERKGGAVQWGIHTVLGVPIPSPNVGRVVILFYSRFDRVEDEEMVTRLSDELTKFMPSPKWKLVVDVGLAPPDASVAVSSEMDVQARELEDIITKNTPNDKHSPLASLLPGFTSLRLMLLKRGRTDREKELVQKAIDVFRRYKHQPGSISQNVAAMVCRDFMQWTRHEMIPSLAQNSRNVQRMQHSVSQSAGAALQQVSGLPGSAQSNQMVQHQAIHPSMIDAQTSGQQALHQQNAVQNQNGLPSNNLSDLLSQNNGFNGVGTEAPFAVSPSLQGMLGQNLASPLLNAAFDGNSDMQPLNISSGNSAGSKHPAMEQRL